MRERHDLNDPAVLVMTDKRGAAVAFYPHHVEHLAPICALMDLPMITCDSPGQAAAIACYPDIRAVIVPGPKVADVIERMCATLREMEIGVVYYCDLIERPALRRYFRDRAAPPRVVHCPHGFSEKRQLWARQVAFQDVALLSGRHSVDQLAQMGVDRPECTILLAGDRRRLYFQQHRDFFARKRTAWGVPHDDSRRTILYAPTWDDRIGSSSFFSAFAAMTEHVPQGSRLIVKMHPHLEKKSDEVGKAVARCAGRDDVVIVRNCPLVHPFLECADVFVGDMSALAYDFLAYNRPMFFLNQAAGSAQDPAESLLFQCGTTIEPRRYAEVYASIEQDSQHDATRFARARHALDEYTYLPARPPSELRAAIAEVLRGDAPAWMQRSANDAD